MADLEEINNRLIKVCTHVENTEKTITEMKVERDKHKDVYWSNMNALKESLQSEREERLQGDNDIKSDLKVAKTRLGFFTGIITIILTGALNWIWRQFK